MRNANFTIIAVAFTAMIFSADLTQAQTFVTYGTSPQVVWSEYPTVAYTVEISTTPVIETQVFTSTVIAEPANPIYEVSPKEYFSTAAPQTMPPKTTAMPAAHKTIVQKVEVQTPALPAPPKATVIKPTDAQPTHTQQPTYVQPTYVQPVVSQPAVNYGSVCMSGG